MKNETPFKIGKSYFIRTATYHSIGKIKAIAGHFIVLSDASWIADSGRFSQAIKYGKLDEVEPVNEAIINIDGIIDAFEWKHSLPREQK